MHKKCPVTSECYSSTTSQSNLCTEKGVSVVHCFEGGDQANCSFSSFYYRMFLCREGQ